MHRRFFLAAALSALAAPAVARPGVGVTLRNVMGESWSFRYDGTFGQTDLDRFAHLTRDRRQDFASPMDPLLLALLADASHQSGEGGVFTITSGYRTPQTNAILPGAAANSFHMRGQALDLWHSSLGIGDLGALFAQTRVGGLGLYGHDGFVHIDTGPFRRWGGAAGDAHNHHSSFVSSGPTGPGRRMPALPSGMMDNPFPLTATPTRGATALMSF